MKLSDAIALGRTLLRPKPFTLYSHDAGCALAMARKSAGLGYAQWESHIWPWIRDQKSPLPCKCGRHIYAQDDGGTIAHLFDYHVFGAKDWTLDQLIDWIASVEPAEPAPAAEPVVAEAEVRA